MACLKLAGLTASVFGRAKTVEQERKKHATNSVVLSWFSDTQGEQLERIRDHVTASRAGACVRPH